MSIETGEFAFPLEYPHPTSHTGMTLRDYFAALAMQSFISNADVYTFTMNGYLSTVAEASYDMADKMLKERSE